MSFGLYEILSVLGSIGLFLYGLKTMSDGLQKFVSRKMPIVLSAMTSTRVLGVFTGFLITLIIQSSSATTVMVVSFVNAGLLSLAQAIGVILGANIGTTVTAWLITFIGFKEAIAPLAIPAIAIGFVLIMFSNEKVKTVGDFLLGFAFLFLGINFLRDTLPGMIGPLELINPEAGELNTILIFAGLGLVLTLILQSSSAVMALTLVLCFNGWVGFEHGAAMVLGENIGTTITANLAAINGNLPAKRAALAHTLFNVIGVFWMLFFMQFFLDLIDRAMISTGLQSPFTTPEITPIGLSVFHSAFNIANVVLLFGFVNIMARGIEWILPSRDKALERSQLEYFSTGFLKAHELSAFQASKETKRFVELAHRMFNFLPEMLNQSSKKELEELKGRMLKYEQIIDKVDLEINSFMLGVSKNNLTIQATAELDKIRLAINEIEKIGDICFKISFAIVQLKREKIEFTPAQRTHIFNMFLLTNQAFEHVLEVFDKGSELGAEHFVKTREIELKINNFRDEAAQEIIEETQKGTVRARNAFYFNKVITACEKVGDNLYSLAEAVSGQKNK
jgi:phosphate:Na+ symporter